MESRGKRLRRAFTPEFKAEVVELCRRGAATGPGAGRRRRGPAGLFVP